MSELAPPPPPQAARTIELASRQAWPACLIFSLRILHSARRKAPPCPAALKQGRATLAAIICDSPGPSAAAPGRDGLPAGESLADECRDTCPGPGLDTLPSRRRTLAARSRTMTKYLISFPAQAMNVPREDLATVGEAARAVIREAKAAAKGSRKKSSKRNTR